MKDPNSHIGEYELLNNRYTKLIILDHQRHEEERKHEIMFLGRKHSQIMSKRAHSSITIDTLFKPDKCGLIPRIVVLQGAAGIGKTMTTHKIMLDWACGDLYQDMFDYIFYINCRKMNICGESRIADIMLKPWNDGDAYKAILRNPKKLLFIIDGFDELRFSFDHPEDFLCSEPRKLEKVEILLWSLFRKKVLPESSLIITTRPTALEKLRKCLDDFVLSSRYAEILGFSEKDREEYFHKFFNNDTDKAAEVFRLIKHNETLFTMCFVPIVCWVVCTVMKQQMERRDFAQTSTTVTDIYMLYFSSLLTSLKSQSKQEMRRLLRGLCCLASYGIWKQEVLFWEEKRKEYGLDQEDSLPLFLLENIFKRDLECKCAYSFIHLTVQELFAALSYLLNPGKQHFCSFGLCVRGQSSELEGFPQGVRNLLDYSVTTRPDLALTVHFLFGLLNEDKRRKMKKMLGWKISPKMKECLLKWVQNKLGAKVANHEMKFNNSGMWHDLLFFECLFETQDENFAKQTLSHVTDLSLNFHTKMEEMVLAYCLVHCCHLEVLCLECLGYTTKECTGSMQARIPQERKQEDDPDGKELLTNSQLQLDNSEASEEYMKDDNEEKKEQLENTERIGKHICKAMKSLASNLRILRLNTFQLAAADCWELSSAFSTHQMLEELHIWSTKLDDSGMRLLCNGLKDPNCRIKKICLGFVCGLTSRGCCENLSSVLINNRFLRELEINCGTLEVSGTKQLCEALSNLNCKLQSLSFRSCYLTAVCCGDLASVLITKKTLRELSLEEVTLGDSAVRRLCEGLKHSDCSLQKLKLSCCSHTGDFCGDLAEVLGTNQTLRELELYFFKVEDRGLKLLCEGLKHPNCKLKTLRLYGLGMTDSFAEDLSTALTINQTLSSVFVADGHMGDTGRKRLYDVLNHPDCKRRNLRQVLSDAISQTRILGKFLERAHACMFLG